MSLRTITLALHLRRQHTPRLWPIKLVDFDTREVRYELGEFNPKLGRVCAR